MKRGAPSLRALMDKAEPLREKGYNCSETVAWALSSYWSLDMNISAVTALGGGISRSGATCGALTGAIVALGCKVGRVDPADNGKKLLCYRLGQQMIERFSKDMGTSVCRDITGFVLGEAGGAERYAASGLKDGKCKDAIEAAIQAAIDVVEGAEARD